MLIEDGKGSGRKAYVDSDHYLRVSTKTSSYQHWYSEHKEELYILTGSHVALNNATENVLFMQNDDTNGKLIAIWDMRLVVVDFAGATAPPSASFYFDVVKGLTYASGGTAVTARNLNLSSGKSADITAYDGSSGDITPAGTAVVLDKIMVEAEGKPQTIFNDGGLILAQGDAIMIRCTTDNTSGQAFVSLQFTVED